jgi:hypothetical protein
MAADPADGGPSPEAIEAIEAIEAMPPGTPLRNAATPCPGYGPLPRSRPRSSS